MGSFFGAKSFKKVSKERKGKIIRNDSFHTCNNLKFA